MALLFPRFQEFSPFFRLVDELDRASRPNQHCGPSTRSFAPRFDVKETKEAYELHGELPGLDQSNVNIEWSDESTLVISGRSEKHVESTNAPAEATSEAPASATEDNDFVEVDTPATTEEQSTSYHKPSVEDEGAEAASEKAAAEPTDAVTKTTEKKTVAKAENQPRYWIAERSYGKFNRTFRFPHRVEHDAVKASLKNGVLQVVVPKAKLREPTRVVIN